MTRRWKATAFPFTEAESVPATMTEAAVAAAGIATEDKQDEILADIAAIVPAGGIYTQTVTVKTTGGAAIPNATVAIYSGSVLIDTKTTNPSGVAQPMCDAGSYTLRVTATGYASYSAALAVTGDATLAVIELAAIAFSPTPDEDQVTAWGYVYSPAGTVEPGATIVLEQRTAGARQIYDNAPRTLTADGSGLVSAVVWADGSEYRYRRGTGSEWSELFAPEDDGNPDLPNSYRLPGWLGAS